jgi:hypothetical protein
MGHNGSLRSRRQKAIREKLDRLDQAFLFERTIDIDTYDRHRDKLREQLTLVQIDRHSSELEEMDVEGILAFAERVLPSASNLWVQSSLAQKQRLQQVFFPDGVRFEGKRLVGTSTTLPVFNYLNPVSEQEKDLVDLTGIEPVRRAEGDADLPEPDQVRPDRATRGMVAQSTESWNPVISWLRRVTALRSAA